MGMRGARVGRPCKICSSGCLEEVERMLLSGVSNDIILDYLRSKTGKSFNVQNIYNHLKHAGSDVQILLKIQRQRKVGITSLDRNVPALDMLWQFIEKGQMRITAQGFDTNTKDFVSSWLKALDIFFKHSELEEVKINDAYRELSAEHQALRYVVNNILTDEQRKLMDERMDELSNIFEGEVVQNEIEGE